MVSNYIHYALVLCMCLLLVHNQHTVTASAIRVNYGYFADEAEPIRVACARGWFDSLPLYKVTCYPQTAGINAASRLDSGSLHLAELGSTPLARALAQEVDIRVVYIIHYKGDSQGIYVRLSNDTAGYVGIENPFDLVNRTVGVVFGSTMHYQVLFLLEMFGMTGRVFLRNLSPNEIMQAWDDGSIDAAACWGAAREHVLVEGASGRPRNVLFTAGDLANWGRPTFNVVAVGREFMDAHAQFVERFVSILGLLTDSFINRLDEGNTHRWVPTLDAESSYLPSLVDAMMHPGEAPREPSIEFIKKQRRELDLNELLLHREQVTCDYLGGPGLDCGKPSLQHIAIQQTAQFLMDQKEIHSMGRLSAMGENGTRACRDTNTLCGSDLFTGVESDAPAFISDLSGDGVAGLFTKSGPDAPAFSLDVWDGVAPFYARNEIGRAREGQFSVGDSHCSVNYLDAKRGVTGYFGDSFNSSLHDVSLVGKSYSGKTFNL